MNRTWMVLSVVLLVVAGMCAPAAARAVSSDSAPPRYVAPLAPGAAEAQQALALGLQMYTPDQPVLLVQDVYPWDFDSNALALAEAEIPFARVTSDQLAVTDLSPVRVLMYSSDQPTYYYENIAANITRISDFVTSGGTLVAHACDQGWSGGDWTGLEILPGGVHHADYFTEYVQIVGPLHPVVAGLDDAYLQGWYYSAHGSFTDLLPGADVVIQNEFAEPTYVDYTWGAGRVLANMQAMEWGYGDGWNYWYVYRPEFLRNEIRLIGELSSRVLDVGEGLGAAGGLGAVPIDLTDTANVAGVQFDLLYDPSLLTPAEVIKTPLTSGPDWEFYWNVVEPGRLAVLGYSSTDTALPPGSGAIAQVIFAVDPGAVVGTVTILHPELIWLSNRTGDSLPVGGADGSLEVGAIHHFAVSVSPAPPEPQGGDLTDPLPFSLHVEARSVADTLVTSYNGLASLTASVGEVQPDTIRFVGGVFEGDVSILLDFDPTCTLIVAESFFGASGASNEFALLGKADPTGDGATNVLDVVRTVNIALERAIPEPPRYAFQFWSANANRDDAVNIQDVILVLRKSLGLPKPAVAVAAAEAAGAPVKASLVEVSRGVWALRVSNAAGVAGAQVEIAGQFSGSAARDGWQVQSSRLQGRTRLLAFSGAAVGLPAGEATLLQLTGVRGRPRLEAVTLCDAMGQLAPVK